MLVKAKMTLASAEKDFPSLVDFSITAEITSKRVDNCGARSQLPSEAQRKSGSDFSVRDLYQGHEEDAERYDVTKNEN